LSKRIHFPKIFPGWWTVLTGGILALWAYGYQAYGISALFKPISSELGFNRAATSVASSIGRFEGGFEAPVTGWVTDRYGPRWIVFLGIFLISAGLVLMGYINSLWSFYAAWGVLVGTGANIALSVPLDTAISNWFVKRRGLALSIKVMFSGLSGVLVMPLIAWLITVQGWRIACLFGGVVMAVVGLPMVWFFLKPHRPEYYGLLPDGAKITAGTTKENHIIEQGTRYAAEVQEVEFTLRQAMRTPAYWLLIVVTAIHGLVTPVMSIHCIPFLTDPSVGMDPVKAAGVMSIYVGVSIPFRFVGGFIADRVKGGYLRFIICAGYLLQAAGIGVFLLHQTIPMIYVWFVLYGVGMGIGNIVPPLMRARYFGRKAFGSIGGTSAMFVTPVGVIAPIYAGWVYDTTGSYMTAFTLFAVLLAVSAAILPFISPPKPPPKLTDVRQIL
jgi:sugar phosphate permease